ncbi:hypothetical protein V5O48_018264 [Marasmius crinis-equi]|uniref:Uncharacterized protein n=1 Tax=Marasmius crinis-equi TaxID=585013 RepID=A0ABR3ELN4_9AGAR
MPDPHSLATSSVAVRHERTESGVRTSPEDFCPRKRQRLDGEDNEEGDEDEEVVDKDGAGGEEEEDEEEWEEAEWPEYTAYFESRLATLKGSLERELEKRPRQYFERLLGEVIAWLKIGRFSTPPHEQTVGFFSSVTNTCQDMYADLWREEGPTVRLTRYQALMQLAYFLYECAREIKEYIEVLVESIERGDSAIIPADRHRCVQNRLRHGTFKFSSARLEELYDAADLERLD